VDIIFGDVDLVHFWGSHGNNKDWPNNDSSNQCLTEFTICQMIFLLKSQFVEWYFFPANDFFYRKVFCYIFSGTFKKRD